MTYQRLSKPRFYMDNANWQFSRGLSRDTALSLNTGTFISGYDKYQLFDMNPLNYAQFNVAAGATTVSVEIDFGVAVPCSHITILNHDLATQGGRIRVAYSASPMATGGGSIIEVAQENLNCGTVSANKIVPSADGDTVCSFTTESARYWVVEFEALTTWAGALTVGEIILGESYTMPISPDMPVTKRTLLDGVDVREAYGGKAYGFSRWILPNTGAYSPFRDATEATRLAGREAFEFSVGFVNDTNLYPSDRASGYASANFLADVVNRSAMNLLPFVFAADSTSTTTGDYLYARFDQNSFETIRKAWLVDSFNLRVVQEF